MLGGADLWKFIEDWFGVDFGWGIFVKVSWGLVWGWFWVGYFGSKFGVDFGREYLGWIQGWQVTWRHISRLTYAKFKKHEQLKSIGIRKKGFDPLEVEV